MDMISDVVSIASCHFSISERVEPCFDNATQAPDFRTDHPVILTPGRLYSPM
ncbi:hypothetical protein [Streptomyces canus]|uniref:hypothetical protein n=1 Tax=Streptomyces canus TaxID=58343 RepID=UPI003714318C